MHDCVVLHASGTVGTDNYHTRFSRKRKSWPATMLSIPEDYVHGSTTDSPPDVLALQHAQSDRYEISVMRHRETHARTRPYSLQHRKDEGKRKRYRLVLMIAMLCVYIGALQKSGIVGT